MSKSGTDEIKITVLDDGRVKIETDAVSAANHSSAEAAIRHLQGLLGGQVSITRSKAEHAHHHHHSHNHVHDHVHE